MSGAVDMLVELTKEARPIRTRVVVIVIVASIIAASFLYLLYETNEHSFDLHGKSMYMIDSDSMDGDVHGSFVPEPGLPGVHVDIDSFPSNSLAIVKLMTAEQLQISLRLGQVVTFKDPRIDGALNEHRVQSTDGILQENPSVSLVSDKTGETILVSLEEITGIVVGVNTFFGTLVNAIQNNIMFITLVAFAVIFADILLLSPRRKHSYKGPVLVKIGRQSDTVSDPDDVR